MPNLSLRGLDPSTLSRIKSSARRRKISVNRLIVETLQKQYAAGERPVRNLDRLAGAWSKAEVARFNAAVAPFAEVDSTLWVAEPEPVYRLKRAPKRKRRK